MSTMKDGGPAFPAEITIDRTTGEARPYQFNNDDFKVPGMTLRDYFAAKAPEPIGFPRKSEWKEQVEEHAPDSKGNTCTVIGRHVVEDGAEYLARWAYRYADAMLAAREVK